MNQSERSNIIVALSQLTAIESREIWKEADRLRQLKASIELFVGDKVTFDARSKGVKVGTIVKLNRVKAQVQVGHTKWTVPFTMLKKVA